jgi:hypothetical protein
LRQAAQAMVAAEVTDEGEVRRVLGDLAG